MWPPSNVARQYFRRFAWWQSPALKELATPSLQTRSWHQRCPCPAPPPQKNPPNPFLFFKNKRLLLSLDSSSLFEKNKNPKRPPDLGQNSSPTLSVLNNDGTWEQSGDIGANPGRRPPEPKKVTPKQGSRYLPAADGTPETPCKA